MYSPNSQSKGFTVRNKFDSSTSRSLVKTVSLVGPSTTTNAKNLKIILRNNNKSQLQQYSQKDGNCFLNKSKKGAYTSSSAKKDQQSSNKSPMNISMQQIEAPATSIICNNVLDDSLKFELEKEISIL